MKKCKFSAVLIFIMLLAGNVHAGEVGDVGIHGFLSQGYLWTTDNNFLANTEKGSFEFNEVGINFTTWLTSDLRVGIQLFARDLGDLGNDEITIDWAYADYHWRDWLGLRVGKIKIAHGFYNETRDIDMLRVPILLPQNLYQEQVRDALIAMKGLGIYGKTPYWPIGAFAYQAVAGTVDIPADGGISKLASAQGTISQVDVDYAYNVGLKWLTPLDGLVINGTVYTLSFDVSFAESAMVKGEYESMVFYTGGLEYIYEELIFTAEYLFLDSHAKINLVLPFGKLALASPGGQTDGWYAAVAYRFNQYLIPGAYYSETYADADDRDNRDKLLKDACATIRVDINDSWIAKVEYHLMRGKGLLFTVDNPSGKDSKWHLFAAKLTYTF